MDHIGPLLAIIEVEVLGPYPNGHDAFRITAAVEHPSADLLAHLQLHPLFDKSLPADENARRIVAFELDAFAKGLPGMGAAASGFLAGAGSAPPPLADLDSNGEAATAWVRIRTHPNPREVAEPLAIDCLARLFDCRARISIEIVYGGVAELIQLSSGAVASERPVFGAFPLVRLAIETSDGSDASILDFDTLSNPFLDIMEAAPPELRATPWGRREVSMSFLEIGIEQALAERALEATFEIHDSTCLGADDGQLGIVLHAEPRAGAATKVAESLALAWPAAFTRA